jgi:hypothetical protein
VSVLPKLKILFYIKRVLRGSAPFDCVDFRTVDHLFDAAAYGKVDAIEGVTASIVMGIPMGLGTGSFDLRTVAMKLPAKKVPLFESMVGDCL